MRRGRGPVGDDPLVERKGIRIEKAAALCSRAPTKRRPTRRETTRRSRDLGSPAGRTRWSGTYRARYLAFAPGAVERMTETPLAQAGIASATLDLSERMTVFHLLAALGQEAHRPAGRPGGGAGSGGRPADAGLLDSVGLAVLRASGAIPADGARRGAALTRRQAARMRDLVAARIGTPLSLAEMAEGSFVRAFKGSFGVTPDQSVLRERVALAPSLLRSGTVSLSEAAARSGFPDARRMGRTFRKVTGHSPTTAVDQARLRRA